MIVNLKSPTDFSGFYIVYEGSTHFETEGTRGISHLLEHLMCRTFKDLRNDFQKDGIDWNATTSNNIVSFYFTGLESSLSKYRHKLIDRISDFDVTKADFELEKKIILEEYSDTFNKQSKRHLLNAYRKYLDCFAPIGSQEDLIKLRYIDLLKFYEKYYLKPSKIINVSKSKPFKSNTIDFSDFEIDKRYKIAEYKNKLELTENKSDKESVIILLDLVSENINRLKLVSKLLSFGLDSPLYQEVREKKALCYSISADVDRFNKQAVLKIQTLTEKGNKDKVVKTVSNVLDNIEKFITKDRVDTVIGYLKQEKKKMQIDRYIHVEDELMPKEQSIYKDLDKVTHKEIIEFFKEIVSKQDRIISFDNKNSM